MVNFAWNEGKENWNEIQNLFCLEDDSTVLIRTSFVHYQITDSLILQFVFLIEEYQRCSLMYLI
jgi:hypothetical protein